MEILRRERDGAIRADAKQKRRMHRLERALVGEVDKKGRLKYELDRIEDAMVAIWKNPEHARDIVARTIPKRIYKENLDPGKKPLRERKKKNGS
jgi:hypothetical protein